MTELELQILGMIQQIHPRLSPLDIKARLSGGEKQRFVNILEALKWLTVEGHVSKGGDSYCTFYTITDKGQKRLEGGSKSNNTLTKMKEQLDLCCELLVLLHPDPGCLPDPKFSGRSQDDPCITCQYSDKNESYSDVVVGVCSAHKVRERINKIKELREEASEAYARENSKKAEIMTARDHPLDIIPRIKTLRHSLGLNQAEFAERYKIGVKALSNWEQGTRKPSRAAETLLELIVAERDYVEDLIDGLDYEG